MKMKLKFSGAAIADFFVVNGEKMVLGVMVLVLLWFLYGAITARPLDDTKSAYAIEQKSKEATERINAVPWDRAPQEEKDKAATVDFQKLIAEDRKEVPISALQLGNEWNPRLFPELTKRGDPEIYPVAELQIASGCAVVPYTAQRDRHACGGKRRENSCRSGAARRARAGGRNQGGVLLDSYGDCARRKRGTGIPAAV